MAFCSNIYFTNALGLELKGHFGSKPEIEKWPFFIGDLIVRRCFEICKENRVCD
jgi:hypothetical protein